MLRLTRIVQTCSACPSQWDAWDEAGTYYYVRYRFGRFTVTKDRVNGELLVNEVLGDRLDGMMDTDEMLAAVAAHT